MRDHQMSDPEIIKACGVLFPSSTIINPVFLNSIEQDQLKAAFRKKALRTHPDRARAMGCSPAEMSRRFQDVSLAYETLKLFLSQRPSSGIRSAAKHPPRPKPSARAATGAAAHTAAHTSGKKSSGPAGRKYSDASARTSNATFTGAGPSGGPSKQDTHRFGLTDHYYKGTIPERELRLGEFLYYSGVISWRTLIGAIVWQKRQRPRFGEIARQWNLLSDEDIEHILQSKTWREKFGEYALRQGFLSSFQQMAVAARQKQMQPRIGAHFVQNGLFSAFHLERLAARSKLHNHNVR